MTDQEVDEAVAEARGLAEALNDALAALEIRLGVRTISVAGTMQYDNGFPPHLSKVTANGVPHDMSRVRLVLELPREQGSDHGLV